MNTTKEEREAMMELVMKSTLKSALEILPFGKVFSDVLFEYRGKVKERRLLSFLASLRDYISENNPQIDVNTIQSDEFGDLFENILRKVSQTRQERKIIGFRNILVKGIVGNSDIYYCDLFSEILTQMHEKQIEILFVYSEELNRLGISLKLRHKLDSELYDLQSTIKKSEENDNSELLINLVDLKFKSEKMKNDLKETNHIRKAEHYNISEGEYQYFLQDLYNKSLLTDEGMGAIGTAPFEIMHVTEFGSKFLDFIVNKETPKKQNVTDIL